MRTFQKSAHTLENGIRGRQAWKVVGRCEGHGACHAVVQGFAFVETETEALAEPLTCGEHGGAINIDLAQVETQFKAFFGK